jgi:hypothetical protein
MKGELTKTLSAIGHYHLKYHPNNDRIISLHQRGFKLGNNKGKRILLIFQDNEIKLNEVLFYSHRKLWRRRRDTNGCSVRGSWQVRRKKSRVERGGALTDDG